MSLAGVGLVKSGPKLGLARAAATARVLAGVRAHMNADTIRCGCTGGILSLLLSALVMSVDGQSKSR